MTWYEKGEKSSKFFHNLEKRIVEKNDTLKIGDSYHY